MPKAFYRFLTGIAFGAILLVIPLSYGATMTWNTFQVGILAVLVLACGVIAIALGEKFVEAVMRLLNAFAP